MGTKKEIVRARKPRTQWILYVGNIVDGIRGIGPFKSCDAALIFADSHIDEQWTSAPLTSPEKYIEEKHS